jgi:putative aldouronate transport system substrate-binding protein
MRKQQNQSSFAKAGAIVFVIALILAACSNNNNNNQASNSPGGTGSAESTASSSADASAQTELTPVSLKWYVPHPGIPTAMDEVEAEVNKITQREINATIDIVPIDFGEYEQKMNTMVAAGDDMDIIWTSSWNFNYIQNVNKGAFLDITELADQYAPKSRALFTDLAWDDAKVNGKQYAVPNYQSFTKMPNYAIKKKYVDKYGLDVTKVKTLEDLEPFLKQVKENEPGIIPMLINVSGAYHSEGYGYTYGGGIFVRFDDPGKVFDADFDPKVAEIRKTVRRFFEAGYINQDAATLKDLAAIKAKGNHAVTLDWSGKPGGEVELASQTGGEEIVFAPVSEPLFSGVTATLNAISRTSKNPERALMLLELVNTNSEVFNLLKYGIKDKHYTMIDDNTIKPIPDSGYNAMSGWIFGNETIGYLVEGQAANTWEKTIELNNSAKASPMAGFNFNNENVKTEVANVDAIYNEMGPALNTGTVDPDKYLPNYQERMKQAGADKILEEKQKQYDEFQKAKVQ